MGAFRQRSLVSARSSPTLTIRTERSTETPARQIDYFGANGELLFSSFVPASPGDGSLSFLGIMFNDALIARVRIKSGNVAPGPDDDGKHDHDIVMMDDFIYGEPQPLP